MGATNENKKKDIEILTGDIVVLPFNEDVAVKASEIYHELRQANQLIEFRDISIGATCIVFDLTVKNSKHKTFRSFKGP